MASGLTLRRADPREAGATRLLQASHALMESLFPSEANHYLSIDALVDPAIHFFVAETDDGPVGCAALAERPGYGEVKSMFVDPLARGSGAGARLLDQLVTEAQARALPCLRLETGTKLDAAHRLYRRHGFSECPAFGDYDPEAPYSLYMERTL